MTTSLGLVDAFEKAAQMSSVAPEHAPEPSSRRLGGVATLAASTHKEKRPAGYPADRRVTLGGAQCACVANAPVAQLPLVSEPAAAGLGQMSSVGGETRSEYRAVPTRCGVSASAPLAPVVLTVGGPTLDSLPLVVHEAPGVSGSAVHVGHVAARAVTDGGPRLGEAS